MITQFGKSFWHILEHSLNDPGKLCTFIDSRYLDYIKLELRRLAPYVKFHLHCACKSLLVKYLEDNPFFSVVKKIKICHCDQKRGAIVSFVDTKICSAPNKVHRGCRLPLRQAKSWKTIDERGKGFHTRFVLKILKTIWIHNCPLVR